MNDAQRAQWIDNFEPLYEWWRQSHRPQRDFIRRNRAEIDAAISRQLQSKRGPSP